MLASFHGRGTEAVITAPTRNRMGLSSAHAGSNPALSEIFDVRNFECEHITNKTLKICPDPTRNLLIRLNHFS